MTESDQRVRKGWLMLLGLSQLNTVWMIFLKRLDISFSAVPQAVWYGVMAGVFLFAFIFNFSLYHCAYKKPGTKFLMFCLIMNGLSFLSLPGNLIAAIAAFKTHIYFGTWIIGSQIMGILWFVLCLKLRKINQKRKLIPV